MKHFLKSFVPASLAILVIVLAGCYNGRVETRTDAVLTAVPIHEQHDYLEANNINERLKLFDNENQLSWIILISQQGQIISYEPVRGKVTSSGKRLEPTTLSTQVRFYDDYTYERISADGTFGSSDAYVFWFDPTGAYHQWNGLYYLTTVPIKISDVVFHTDDVDREQLLRQQLAIEALKAGKCVDNQLNIYDCNQPAPTPSPTAAP